MTADAIYTDRIYQRKAAEFLKLRAAEERFKKQKLAQRDDLRAYLAREGYEDEKGNRYLELPEPVTVVNAKGEEVTYRVLKLERKVFTSLNEEAAEDLVTRKGLRSRVVRTIEVFDFDELYVLNQEGEVSDDELDSLFDADEQFALVPLVE